jgi:hypothetical protein
MFRLAGIAVGGWAAGVTLTAGQLGVECGIPSCGPSLLRADMFLVVMLRKFQTEN